MKRLALWLLLGEFALALQAQNPDAEFLRVYTLIQEGESLEKTGQAGNAMDRYRQAQRDLEAFAKAYPSWNQKIIRFRVQYLSTKIGSLEHQPASAPTLEPAKPALSSEPTRAAPKPESGPAIELSRAQSGGAEPKVESAEKRLELALRSADDATARANLADERNAQLALDLRLARDRVEVLEASRLNLEKTRDGLERDRVTLEARLKEALSPKPAALDPAELTKAQERNLLLMKENEILKASLERQVSENQRIVETAAKALELERQLDSTRAELATQRRQNEELRGERQKLMARVEGLSRQAGEKSTEDTSALRNEIDSLRRELASARSGKAGRSQELDADLAALRKQLAEQRSATESLRAENADLLRSLERHTAIRVTPASLKIAELPSDEATSPDWNRIRRLERERDELQRELGEARAEARRREVATAQNPARDFSEEVERLGARVATLEARAEPYSAEELALFKAPSQRETLGGEWVRPAGFSHDIPQWRSSSTPGPEMFSPPVDVVDTSAVHGLNEPIDVAVPVPVPVPSGPAAAADPIQIAQATPAAPAPAPPTAQADTPRPSTNSVAAPETQPGSTNAIGGSNAPRRRTVKDLPPGASVLAAQAQRAFAQRRFEEAEKRYREILQLDENNVFTLGNLAAILVERDRLEDGEAMLARALQKDPQDPFSLSLQGIIRFRQRRYDEAFDSLSRSAQIDPDNADTQNYLGITLSQRGQRVAAEAALRKALKLNPSSASAHYNLAVVYATQKPPYLELARYHYEKSRRAGQAPNPSFEGVLRGGEAPRLPPPLHPSLHPPRDGGRLAKAVCRQSPEEPS